MTEAWQILRAAGLPLAIEGSRRAHDVAELAGAVAQAIREDPDGRDAEALAAFIFAWSHHWPHSFADAFGATRDATLAWATSHVLDDGRYLKLRRISIENLSHVL